MDLALRGIHSENSFDDRDRSPLASFNLLQIYAKAATATRLPIEKQSHGTSPVNTPMPDQPHLSEYVNPPSLTAWLDAIREHIPTIRENLDRRGYRQLQWPSAVDPAKPNEASLEHEAFLRPSDPRALSRLLSTLALREGEHLLRSGESRRHVLGDLIVRRVVRRPGTQSSDLYLDLPDAHFTAGGTTIRRRLRSARFMTWAADTEALPVHNVELPFVVLSETGLTARIEFNWRGPLRSSTPTSHQSEIDCPTLITALLGRSIGDAQPLIHHDTVRQKFQLLRADGTEAKPCAVVNIDHVTARLVNEVGLTRHANVDLSLEQVVDEGSFEFLLALVEQFSTRFGLEPSLETKAMRDLRLIGDNDASHGGYVPLAGRARPADITQESEGRGKFNVGLLCTAADGDVSLRTPFEGRDDRHLRVIVEVPNLEAGSPRDIERLLSPLLSDDALDAILVSSSAGMEHGVLDALGKTDTPVFWEEDPPSSLRSSWMSAGDTSASRHLLRIDALRWFSAVERAAHDIRAGTIGLPRHVSMYCAELPPGSAQSTTKRTTPSDWANARLQQLVLMVRELLLTLCGDITTGRIQSSSGSSGDHYLVTLTFVSGATSSIVLDTSHAGGRQADVWGDAGHLVIRSEATSGTIHMDGLRWECSDAESVEHEPDMDDLPSRLHAFFTLLALERRTMLHDPDLARTSQIFNGLLAEELEEGK